MRFLLPIVLGVLCGGCGQQGAVPPQTSEPRPAGAAPPPAVGVLQLDPGMVRDLRMTTAAVERRTASAEVDMLGEIGVDRERYVEIAPPIDAQVMRLLVPVNAVVREGQTLAELRSPEIGQARAARITADARLQLATQTLERKRSLAAERIVAARELQEAETLLQEAQVALRAATAGLRALGATAADDAASDDSAQFFLRAPITGTVLERSAVVGQLAQASQPMYRIADLRRVWLTVHAFERDAVQIAMRAPVRITLAATPGRVFMGQVAAIASEVDAVSRTLDVRIDLVNGDGILRPGMSATAHMPVQAGGRELLAVPAAAVQRVGEDWVVFIPRGAAAFERRRIGRGRDLGTEVEVASGLRGDETVVVEGAFLLKAEAEKTAGGDEHAHEE